MRVRLGPSWRRGLIRLVLVVATVWILLPYISRTWREHTEDTNFIEDNVVKPVNLIKNLKEEAMTTSTTSTTTVANLADVGSNDVHKVMKHRRGVMKQVCHKHGLDVLGEDALHQPRPWEFFINSKHHLVWCNVFKSASSSWMYNFNILAGYSPRFLKTTKKVPLALAREKYPRPSLKQLQDEMKREDSVSFIIARNPLERLISGYRDKIVKALRGSYHDKMRRKIVRKYRKVSYVPQYPRQRISTSQVPTFKEFVKFVMEEKEAGGEWDMHWAPVYSFCNPCQVDFKVIASFETLERDLDFVISSAHIEHLIKAEKRNEAKGGWKSREMVMAYLKDLGEPLYNKLVETYRIDMEMFGYQIKQFKDL